MVISPSGRGTGSASPYYIYNGPVKRQLGYISVWERDGVSLPVLYLQWSCKEGAWLYLRLGEYYIYNDRVSPPYYIYNGPVKRQLGYISVWERDGVSPPYYIYNGPVKRQLGYISVWERDGVSPPYYIYNGPVKRQLGYISVWEMDRVSPPYYIYNGPVKRQLGYISIWERDRVSLPVLYLQWSCKEAAWLYLRLGEGQGQPPRTISTMVL